MPIPQPKAKTWRSELYLAFVREFPCARCSRPGPSDAHHYRGSKGMGIKPSDAFTVPLCREHHDEFHRKGALGDLSPAETRAAFDSAAVQLLAWYIEKKR